MADPNNRSPGNVIGPYFVDTSCTDCDLCRLTAPEFFKRNDETGFSIVYRQPVSEEEIQLAQEALTGCPSESIGDDGTAAAEADREERGVSPE